MTKDQTSADAPEAKESVPASVITREQIAAVISDALDRIEEPIRRAGRGGLANRALLEGSIVQRLTLSASVALDAKPPERPRVKAQRPKAPFPSSVKAPSAFEQLERAKRKMFGRKPPDDVT